MDQSNELMEIGWKTDLSVDNEKKKCKKQHQSPDNEKKSKNNYERLISPDTSGSGKNSRSSTSTSLSSCERLASPKSKDKKREQKLERKKQRKIRKAEKKMKKQKRKMEKARLKQLKKAKREQHKAEKKMRKLAKKMKAANQNPTEDSDNDLGVPVDLMFTKAKAPETPKEYEAKQKQIRRVTDADTGRTRLIKGDGEILEEIVSRDRHRDINAMATQCDGEFFQSKTVGWNMQ